MYYIAICDDDADFARTFYQKLAAVLSSKKIDAKVEVFHSTDAFLCRAEGGQSFDLIFLDIYLGAENGYHFAKKLRGEQIDVDIIFITTTQDYAVAGYDVSPILYLVKPVQNEQLAYAIELFLKKHQPKRVILNLSGETISLNVADILYIEVYGHTTCLHLTSGESRELRLPLNKLERQLPSSVFIRSHQSYLVNMGHILGIARYQLTLSTGLTLPISQSKYLNLQNSFILHIKQKKLWL